VSKLIFAECGGHFVTGIPSGGFTNLKCAVPGTQFFDKVIATKNIGNICFTLVNASVSEANTVNLLLKNDCPSSQTFGSDLFGIIVHD